MSSQDDVREISGGSAKKKPRFDKRDFDQIADFVVSTRDKRKNSSHRKTLEKQWKEVDRQIAMEPDIAYKLNERGHRVHERAWMPEYELPLQAETLEVLNADARRLMFPDSGPWFQAQAELSDEYLRRVDFQGLVAGDENEVPSKINQDNANKIARAYLEHFHRQYDFRRNVELVNGEAFRYGVGVGRVRPVTKQIFMPTARGIVKDTQKIPVFVPRTIKKTYLDETEHEILSAGHMIGSSTIYEEKVKFEDLVLAATAGSNDPEDFDGGWMPAAIKGFEGDENGNVELVEMEGDFVVSRKTTGSIYIPNAIATVAVGKKDDKQTATTVRFRFRSVNRSTYITFPYHDEEIESPYSMSPLMKAQPIQHAASFQLNMVSASALLNIGPPVGHDKDDATFEAEGGPVIQPWAVWATAGDLNVHNDISNPQALLQVYTLLIQQYSDLTGITAPRLGQQTKSHTTAFSKQAELQRGTIRTVDYVKATLDGALTSLLQLEYEMGQKTIGRQEITMPIEDYGGYVNITKDALPDNVLFQAFGAGGPLEEQEKEARFMNAIQQSVNIDQLKLQLGGQPLNYEELQKQIFINAGVTDVDPLFTSSSQGPTGGAASGQPVPGPVDGAGNAAPAALQALAISGQGEG